jgi:hypothetical protein
MSAPGARRTDTRASDQGPKVQERKRIASPVVFDQDVTRILCARLTKVRDNSVGRSQPSIGFEHSRKLIDRSVVARTKAPSFRRRASKLEVSLRLRRSMSRLEFQKKSPRPGDRPHDARELRESRLRVVEVPAEEIGIAAACEGLGFSRARFYRQRAAGGAHPLVL